MFSLSISPAESPQTGRVEEERGGGERRWRRKEVEEERGLGRVDPEEWV